MYVFVNEYFAYNLCDFLYGFLLRKYCGSSFYFFVFVFFLGLYFIYNFVSESKSIR